MINNETFKDWIYTFWRVLILPTPKTFLAESQKADGKFTSAVGWLIFFVVYIFIFSIFIFKQVLITGFVGMILVIPLTIILFTSAMHFVYQRMFKRKQFIYDKLIYLNTAILLSIQFLFVPLSTLFLPVSTVTINSILSYGILLYQFILITIAFKSISNLKYWQASITVVISILAAGITLLCTIPFVLSMMGGVNTIMR